MFLIQVCRLAHNWWKNKMAPVYKMLLKWEKHVILSTPSAFLCDRADTQADGVGQG